MTAYDVHLSHITPAPVAVMRRQARASELATIVSKCCGLVWEFVRAHHLKAGRHVGCSAVPPSSRHSPKPGRGVCPGTATFGAEVSAVPSMRPPSPTLKWALQPA